MTLFKWPRAWLNRALTPWAISMLCALPHLVLAQNGDKTGETQPPLNPDWKIPEAPALPPHEALKTFQLPEGFKIELVASEPLVHDPVEIEFDAAGRIWAVEMRGYMPNVEGAREDEPVGRIVVLEDRDGDGVMDESTVFADGLVMPRALCLVDQGALVAEPPNLWHLKDLNGDMVADQKRLIAEDYGGTNNPEHTANALLWAVDNWIYSANHTTRFQFQQGDFKREPTVYRGQWGMTMDAYGRLIYNSNSDQLRGDLLPADLLARNPSLARPFGVNYRIAKDQRVWPGRVTPGVNRGYRPGVLNKEGKLTRFTAASGPLVFQGTRMPAEFYGNAFVPEPSANLIKRNIIQESNAVLSANPAYAGKEFLTSTDERFRPVNLNNGPDGSLYVVDFYRGIIQHRIYMTSFLRKQVEVRDLAKPVGLGRIYRIYHQDHPAPPVSVSLSSMNPETLVGQLGHRNGWRRMTAQRLLVERQVTDVAPLLMEMANGSDSHLGRIHALRTLDGMKRMSSATLLSGLNDPHPKVRAAAVELSRDRIQTDTAVADRILKLMEDPDAYVRYHAYLQIDRFPPDQAVNLLARNLLDHEAQPGTDALFSSIAGLETAVLKELSLRDEELDSGERLLDLVEMLARYAFESKQSDQVEALLEAISQMKDSKPDIQKSAIRGILSLRPKPQTGQPAPKARPVTLSKKPGLLIELASSDDPDLEEWGTQLDELIDWPEKADGGGDASPIELTAEQESLRELGAILYTASCAACHQPHGNGQDGLAPPLVDSEWVLGSPERLARIVLHGLTGPITVKGEEYSLAMPGLMVFNDQQIAAILTYVRREWGHEAAPVSPETVARIRELYPDRYDMWTAEELLQVK